MYSVLSTHDYTDVPPSSTNPGTQPSTNPGTQLASVTQPRGSGSPVDFALVAGVAGSMVVLVLIIAVSIVVLVMWCRR